MGLAAAVITTPTTTTATIGTTTAATNIGKPLQPLIDKETKILLDYVIQIGLFFITAILGIVVNTINIIVYKKQGLKDSITVGLFALSISDLFVSGLPMETAICYVLKSIYPNSKFPYTSVLYVHSAWTRKMFYSLSCTITATLSLERCVCVIAPFKVKVIFTKTRTAIIIASLATVHVLCFVPIFASHQLRWKKAPPSSPPSSPSSSKPDPVSNSNLDSNSISNSSSNPGGSIISPLPRSPNSNNETQYFLRLWLAPHRDIIEDFNYTFMSVITPTLSQVVVTCCVVVMIHGLRQASKFRQAMTSHAAPSTTKPTTNKTTPNNNHNNTTSIKFYDDEPETELTDAKQQTSTTTTITNTLSPRDARLVRTMVFLVALLSACNVPYLILINARLLHPEFGMFRRFHNSFSLAFSINYVFANLNASLNFFIYYNTSTRYKQVFRQIFRCHTESKQDP